MEGARIWAVQDTMDQEVGYLVTMERGPAKFPMPVFYFERRADKHPDVPAELAVKARNANHTAVCVALAEEGSIVTVEDFVGYILNPLDERGQRLVTVEALFLDGGGFALANVRNVKEHDAIVKRADDEWSAKVTREAKISEESVDDRDSDTEQSTRCMLSGRSQERLQIIVGRRR